MIGNPGQPFQNGVTPADYLSTADVFDLFEGPSSGFSAYPYGLNWFQSYPSNRFSNTIYDAASSALSADIKRAVQLNAGDVYITDQALPNPYDQLPSYWDQEVADIRGLSVPEAGTLPMLVVAGLVMVGLAAAKRQALA